MDNKTLNQHLDKFYLLGFKHATAESEIDIEFARITTKRLKEAYKEKYKEDV